MVKPTSDEPTDETRQVGRVWKTPLVVQGHTWLPLTQVIAWAIMTVVMHRKHPQRSAWQQFYAGGLTAAVILGSEWGHNLAHAAAAQWVGKPMDALRIAWGMPRVIYDDVNDCGVTPREHIVRALGGPLFNAALLGVTWFLCRLTRTGTVARDVAGAAVGMNAFLCTVSLLPIPGIDGGPILKWSLVERGRSVSEADQVVRNVNKALGSGMGVAAGVTLRRRRWFAGALLALLSALSLAIGFGLLREQN